MTGEKWKKTRNGIFKEKNRFSQKQIKKKNNI